MIDIKPITLVRNHYDNASFAEWNLHPTVPLKSNAGFMHLNPQFSELVVCKSFLVGPHHEFLFTRLCTSWRHGYC